MRRWLLAAMLLSAAAYAQEGGRPPEQPATPESRQEAGRQVPETIEANQPAETPGGHGTHDVPSFVMHHVADSEEYEFEIPLNVHGENPVLHFPDWRIPLKAGGCPLDREEKVPVTQCLDLTLTKHTFMMFIASALLLLVMLLVPNRDKSQLVPKGTGAGLVEFLVLFVRDIAVSNIGKKWAPKYTPYLLSAFFFILFMNLLGLLPWMATATGNLAITASMAFCTFVLTQYASIRAAGLGTYLKHLTGGVPPYLWAIMIPVEVLGLFTKPFALAVRLFANMLAGHIVIFFLLGLIFIMSSAGLAFMSVPFAMGIYFLELFVAVVQAYIFTMLSALFIGLGVAIAHHDEGHKTEEGSHSAPAQGAAAAIPH